jgi:hypothetical protein
VSDAVVGMHLGFDRTFVLKDTKRDHVNEDPPGGDGKRLCEAVGQ